MSARSAVVLVIDGLGAGWLGPYGNTWLDTPNFNRLAASALLFESAIADSPDLSQAFRSLWTGKHAMAPGGFQEWTLAQAVADAGKNTILLADDPAVADHTLAMHFGCRSVLPDDWPKQCADTVEQSGLFAFFDAARTVIAEQANPHLLWLHTRGLRGPWDAPLELRHQFADEEDPDPPNLVVPPNVALSEDFDPDQLLGFVQAYAGQVALADMGLGMLLDALDEQPQSDETLLVVTAPRGFPLGEHRRVGPCDDALYGELLHVPLLVRFPNREHALVRSRQIVQPAAVPAMVAEQLGCPFPFPGVASAFVDRIAGEEGTHSCQIACAVGNGQRAIRTPAWFMRQSPNENGIQHELFAKPDDQWEANEVSSRCTDIAELLAAELDHFEANAKHGIFYSQQPLAEPLCSVWR